MTEPVAMTPEQIRDYLIRYMKTELHYWMSLEGKTCEERMDGLGFSFLTILDGVGVGDLCCFDLVARSGADAKDDAIDNEEPQYVEDGTVVSCMFHEYWHQR